MAFVEWKDEYSVGLDAVDAQHRQLLQIIDRMHDAMKMGGKPAAISAVVNELIGYTRYHFAFEERLMESAAYPGLEEHRRRHRAMVAQVETFREQALTGSAAVSLKLMAFLKDWLSRHILETDRRYAAHLQAAHA